MTMSVSRDNLPSPSPWFTVERCQEFGQFLRASRDIEASTLIVEEVPAFYGPSADYVEDYTTPICLGCAVVMNDGNEMNRCSTCNWPICGTDCQNASYHRERECELFAQEKVAFPPENLPIQNCYKGITILRGILLRDKNPGMWEKVMNLQFQNEITDSEEEMDFNEFKTQFGLPNFGSNEDWKRILGVLNCNSYSIQRIERKIGSPSFAEFIYPYQCLCNHSCVPNCNWAISYSPEFIIRVQASVPIKKGEMLTVAYNYDLTKYGVHKRQERIREQAKFNCKCPRCLDPTDLSTFAGGVVCFKCKTGIMLPLESIDPESDWKCGECSYKMDKSFVSSFVDSLQEQVEMAETEVDEGTEGETVVDILEDFISDKAGSVLHPNHWVLTLAAQSIINHQSSRLNQLTLEELDRLIGHCEHVLKIRNVTPGTSTEKGMLQHHIARAKFRRMEFASQEKLVTNSPEMEEEIKMVWELQKTARLFWSENLHYGTLHSNYKLDAQLLKEEMDHLKSKYTFLQ